MRDAQGSEIRRGDRLVDGNGDIFMVKDVAPDVMHIQSVKTGRRYTIGLPAFVKIPFGAVKGGDLDTRLERVAYFRKRAGRLRH